jgi:hypothetical protein
MRMLPTIIESVGQALNMEVPVGSTQFQPRHMHVCCDGCGKQNIQGVRYKCGTCADFDFCEECESSKEHPHCFIKVKQPGSLPRQPHCHMFKEVRRMVKQCVGELKHETGEDVAELLIGRLAQHGVNPDELRSKPLIRGKTLPELVRKFLDKEE